VRELLQLRDVAHGSKGEILKLSPWFPFLPQKETSGGRLGAEQIVTKLRQIEVLQGQGKNIAAACKEIGTTEQTFYRWRKEYGGLNVDQAKRLKQLEDENGRLKKLVADLSLEKQVLRDIAQGKL
jgi:hypothetical protein